MSPETILIVGGTGDARALAERLGGASWRIVTSLAGRTAEPELPKGDVRIGGFGGVDGLARYIAEENVTLVADAAHPFASRISANAAEACHRTGIPYLRLERPAWMEGPGDRWTRVADVEQAARALRPNATALVTVGRQEIDPFLARRDVTIVARMIEPPDIGIPGNCEIVLARPPYTMAFERVMFHDKGIDVLVAKNSGGAATQAKLLVARELEVPVIMIERPPKPAAPTAADVETMAALIATKLS